MVRTISLAATTVSQLEGLARARDAFLAGEADANRNCIADANECGDEGTFIWADSIDEEFLSTGPNQFLVRAGGGVGINENAPEAELHVTRESTDLDATSLFDENIVVDDEDAVIGAYSNPVGVFGSALVLGEIGDDGSLTDKWSLFRTTSSANDEALLFSYGPNPNYSLNTSRLRLRVSGNPLIVGTVGDTSNGNGAHVTAGGVWTNGSSRQFKTAVQPIDPLAMLRKVVGLPLNRWRYKNDDDAEHVGPMAEDFAAAFGLGHDERYIGTVDADGVALAAIQGLNRKLEQESARQRQRIEVLEAQLNQLHAAVSQLALQGGSQP